MAATASSRRCWAGGSAAGPRPASLVTARVAIVLAVGFDLSAIASIGSAIALLVFTLVSVGTCPGPARDRGQPRPPGHGDRGDGVVLVAFAFTTLVDEPGTAVALVVIMAVSIVLEPGHDDVRPRRRERGSRPPRRPRLSPLYPRAA